MRASVQRRMCVLLYLKKSCGHIHNCTQQLQRWADVTFSICISYINVFHFRKNIFHKIFHTRGRLIIIRLVNIFHTRGRLIIIRLVNLFVYNIKSLSFLSYAGDDVSAHFFCTPCDKSQSALDSLSHDNRARCVCFHYY